MTGATISVCIPTFNKSSNIIREAVDSAVDQLEPGDELIIAPQGPRAEGAVRPLQLPSEVRILSGDQPGGLVGNWNRCLSESRRELVHLLHDDDVIAPGFYQAIRSLAVRYPQAALYVTGAAAYSDRLGRNNDESPVHLSGPLAAKFLLGAEWYCCGSVVLPRRSIEQLGQFSERFPYCPDEEAYLRYVVRGGLAFHPEPLYRQRISGAQARYATWREHDFVSIYMAARIEGAAHFGPRMIEFAKESTARAAIGVALTIGLQGLSGVGASHLQTLARIYPACTSWPRFRLARLALSSRTALSLVRVRRSILAKTRVGRSWR